MTKTFLTAIKEREICSSHHHSQQQLKPTCLLLRIASLNIKLSPLDYSSCLATLSQSSLKLLLLLKNRFTLILSAFLARYLWLKLDNCRLKAGIFMLSRYLIAMLSIMRLIIAYDKMKSIVVALL